MYNFLKILLDPLIFVFGFAVIALLYLFRDKKGNAIKIFITLSLIILYTASIYPVANLMCYAVERDYLLNGTAIPDQLNIIVVLGGGISSNRYVRESSPSHQTASRLIHARQIFKATSAQYLVCSGNGAGRITEAEVMGNAAERLGIPRQKIKLDLKSDNTKEHAEELNKMFDDKNIKIGLVTSAYHMKRSENEFKKYFPNVVPSPSDFLYTSSALSLSIFLPSSTNLYKFSIAFREIIGIVWYKIKNIL